LENPAILQKKERAACGGPRWRYVAEIMASENVQVFNDLNFEEAVLKSDKPVLVDFTATWCGPCKQLAPIIDQVADELGEEGIVGKLDIDEAPLTAGKFGVRGVPTVMVFRNGERAEQHVGLTTKAKLLALVRG
jgi:thioredoxin 1